MSELTAAALSTKTEPAITVAVIGICGARHLARCLDALGAQRNAPPFHILVVHDPMIPGMDAIRTRYPSVEIISNEGQRTPLQLASRAVSAARGELILLTEDHCVPDPDWVASLCREHAPGRAAVGGVVEPGPGSGAVAWAFYFVDFFRYMPPVPHGRSPSLTVCNVSYRRADLEAIAPVWAENFHETAVNDALRVRFGELWITPRAVTIMRRNVRFRDALHERYAFGRLFGCTRLAFLRSGHRALYSILAPGLPILLLGRMAAKAARSRRARISFLRSTPALVGLVLSWSLGEWLGYLTARLPRSLLVAPEIATTAGES